MIRLNKSIGLIKNKYGNQKVKIFEAYYKMKRISQFQSNDEVKPLIDIVGKWRFFIGVKEELTQEELFMNVTFIRENFGELNLLDINEAMNLSIKGVLNVDVEHYQAFTPLYISKILNAYKKYKGEIIVDIGNQIKTIENKPTKPTSEQLINLTKENLKTQFKERDSKAFSDYGSVLYDFIKKNKLVLFTKELVNEAMEYGKKQVLQGTRDSAYADVINNTTTKLKNARNKKEFNIRQNARNYVVKKWLNTFDEESFEIFLENINDKMIN